MLVVTGLESLIDPSFIGYSVGGQDKDTAIAMGAGVYSLLAFLFLFYPLAGCLADIRWGRHKTVINSLCIIWWSLVI